MIVCNTLTVYICHVIRICRAQPENFGPHNRFAGQWPAGFSKRVASGTEGSIFPSQRKILQKGGGGGGGHCKIGVKE